MLCLSLIAFESISRLLVHGFAGFEKTFLLNFNRTTSLRVVQGLNCGEKSVALVEFFRGVLVFPCSTALDRFIEILNQFLEIRALDYEIKLALEDDVDGGGRVMLAENELVSMKLNFV